jgi:hypothetical protein
MKRVWCIVIWMSDNQDQRTIDKIHDYGWKYRTILYGGQTVAFRNKNFEVVNEFVY